MRGNREQVAAIRQAWRELMPENPPITYGSGPAVNLDLYAQVAVDALAALDRGDRPMKKKLHYRIEALVESDWDADDLALYIEGYLKDVKNLTIKNLSVYAATYMPQTWGQK